MTQIVQKPFMPPSNAQRASDWREMANAVLRIISSRIAPFTFTSGALSSLGSLGYSSGAIPTILKCADPEEIST